MSHTIVLNHQSVAPQLSAAVYHQLIDTLCRTLPDPPTNRPEDLASRDDAAKTLIKNLQPANALEANQVALFIAATEQWKACLRLIKQPETSLEWAIKCRAQALSLMRQAQGALNVLARMQAARQNATQAPSPCDTPRVPPPKPVPTPSVTRSADAATPDMPTPQPRPVAGLRHALLTTTSHAGAAAPRTAALPRALQQLDNPPNHLLPRPPSPPA